MKNKWMKRRGRSIKQVRYRANLFLDATIKKMLMQHRTRRNKYVCCGQETEKLIRNQNNAVPKLGRVCEDAFLSIIQHVNKRG